MLFKSKGTDTSFNVGGKMSPLTVDSAVTINAWERHCYNHDPRAPSTEILAFYLEPSWLASVDSIFAASNHRDFFPNSCVALDIELKTKVTKICREMSNGPLDNVHNVQQQIFDLTVSIAHRFANWRVAGRTQELERNIYDYRIRRSIEYMRAHPDYRLSIDKLASIVSLSRPRFYELFRDCTGLTPNLFSSMLVVENAIDQLANTNGTIANVAYELGFSEHSNFARFFSQHVGCSPSDYRRKVDLFRTA